MNKGILLIIGVAILSSLAAKDHKLRSRDYKEIAASFNSEDGIEAVKEAFVGTSETDKFSEECATAISANMGQPDNKYFAWDIQKSKCSQHLLQAMVVYAIASIDPN